VIKYGKLDIDVTNKMLNDLKFVDYFQCYRQYDKLHHYYTEGNSSIWQMFDESPQWVHDFAKQLPQDFDHHVVSVIKIDPGQTIPHQPFTKWSAGEWVKFGNDDWHIAGNMGDEPFYSAQVTVLKNV